MEIEKKEYVVGQNAPMTGNEIAKEFGITRQAVSSSIRRSMMKMYRQVLNKGMAETPMEAVLVLMTSLGVANDDVSEVKKFIKLFDKDLIEKVKKEMQEGINI